MNREQRELVLTKLYELYDQFISDYQLACKKKCSACCTPNVTLTSLEGYRIARYLMENSREDLLEKLRKELTEHRFQPKVTVNELANLCADEKEIPDEGNETILGDCPLLTEKECPIYDHRPFECRSFNSKINCEEEGLADMDRFVMSVNHVFKQYIEQIDAAGVTGNFTDLVLYLVDSENKEIIQGNTQDLPEKLLPNQPAKVLMVPPEHQEKMEKVIESIQTIRI